MNRLCLRLTPTPGSIALIAIAVAYPLLWLVARPAGEPAGRYLGEMCGAEAVLLLSACLCGRSPRSDMWIDMCGPSAMTGSLSEGFRGMGVPASRVRWEHFDIR